MKMRYLTFGVAAAALLLGSSAQVHAGPIDLAVSTSPYNHAVATIEVDGPTAAGSYTEIRTKTLDYIVSVRGDRPKRPKGGGHLWIELGEDHEEGQISGDWQNYKVSTPYADPRSPDVVNDRVSPIDVCNQNLQLKSKLGLGGKFRKEGLAFIYHDAYELKGLVNYGENTATQSGKHYSKSTLVPVKITCMPLDRIRPRSHSETKPAPSHSGQKMKPTISEVSLRVEPAQIVQMGKFLCPSQLKLYGHAEARRKFYGKALFVGPHYLSNITILNFQAEGSRNVTGTYTIDWQKMGGLTTVPNQEPKKQKRTFHFNIADKDGKLLDSAEETVEVSCRKIKVNVPTVGDEMSVAPSN